MLVNNSQNLINIENNTKIIIIIVNFIHTEVAVKIVDKKNALFVVAAVKLIGGLSFIKYWTWQAK